MIHPQVSNNGTSRTELIEVRMAVLRALHPAIQALQEAAPNGRDYQFRPEEFAGAVREHRERVDSLEQVLREIGEQVRVLQEEGR